MSNKKILSSNLGYPRIGEDREWKSALESFWANELDEETFLSKMERLRLGHLLKQENLGVDLIPIGDFTLYDRMLDTAVMFGMIPERFNYDGGIVPLHTYYAMARGNTEARACKMTKWFNTNYHYIVPEYSETVKLSLTENKPLIAYREARVKLGFKTKPVLIGPYTFLKLTKGYDFDQRMDFLNQLTPLYGQVLAELEREGVEWVQLDEPILVTSLAEEEMVIIESIYEELDRAAPRLNKIIQTYFDSVTYYEQVVNLPVQGIGLDFVHGREDNLYSLQMRGFPHDKIMGVGLIDGRNIWKANLVEKLSLIEEIAETLSYDRMIIQPSCSLVHVPITVKDETELESSLEKVLSFADEKLEEMNFLMEGIRSGKDEAEKQLEKTKAALREAATAIHRNRAEVQDAMKDVDQYSKPRQTPFSERYALQQRRWNLPFLPTTTIGSFPQTIEVRDARKKFKKNDWSAAEYELFIQKKIDEWIEIQESIGLDVFVHGEFERTDLVEFFGGKLAGVAITQNGWVQSFGARCVRPPIIYGDVEFLDPMTVEETVYAQSLTSKPVKGMLTGPTTLLNWSYAREDIPHKQVAQQIALALREEVKALEDSGIHMIQVDEPALQEGLPLKESKWREYLDWTVAVFRIATSSVKDHTQIHTHMCYSELHDIIESIQELDADVISIETTRSQEGLIRAFKDHTYDRGLGLGVYDIHSPRVPDVKAMSELIERALRVLDPSLFWVNPDCGLKTRGKEETILALKNMVEATKLVRKRHEAE